MKKMLIERVKKLLYSMLSLSFLSWLALLSIYVKNGQAIDMEFLLFTASVIGIRSYFKSKDVNNENNK